MLIAGTKKIEERSGVSNLVAYTSDSNPDQRILLLLLRR